MKTFWILAAMLMAFGCTQPDLSGTKTRLRESAESVANTNLKEQVAAQLAVSDETWGCEGSKLSELEFLDIGTNLMQVSYTITGTCKSLDPSSEVFSESVDEVTCSYLLDSAKFTFSNGVKGGRVNLNGEEIIQNPGDLEDGRITYSDGTIGQWCPGTE